MKFDEKLMKLRKENAWSQEEFADKLNVSRQTVSKWELGQTVPDTNNLTKIASVFGITVNDLLDENSNPVQEKVNNYNKVHNKNGRPFLIIILIIILIIAIFGIGAITVNKILGRMINQVSSEFVSQTSDEQSVFGIFGEIFEKIRKIKQESFNSNLKDRYYGSVSGAFIDSFIDEVLKSNEENNDKLITLKYKDFESNSATDIRALKRQIKNGINDQYEVYYEYDEEGYINKAIIEDVKINAQSNETTQEMMSEFEVTRFNQVFKSNYFGSTNGFFMIGFIDNVIKSNEENPKHIITVSYEGTETSDANELRAMKKKFSNTVDYEVYYEYDENGLINKAIVEK